MDFGKILLEYEAEEKEKSSFSKLKKDVHSLKLKKEALEERENKLVNDINEGNHLVVQKYKLPLSLISSENAFQPKETLTESDVESLKNIAKDKKKLESHAICHGITCSIEEEETKYFFDPYIEGVPYGPYVIRLKFTRNKVVLRGHTIPHAVLTRSIYSEHFENHLNPNINVEPFLKTIASNLRAFLSRKQQCDALQNRYAEIVRDLQTTHHYTAVNFTLFIRDNKDAVATSIPIKISMIYNRDEERPKDGSVKIIFPNGSDEDNDDLKENCSLFYEFSLSEAVSEAF